MQTVLFEAANLCNERPLGVSKKVQADGTYLVLMPNCLLIGRATNGPDVFMESKLTKLQRFKLVQSITKHFWERWSMEVTPDWLLRRKWHETGHNLKVGDIVLVHDKTPLKGKYLLAIVEAVSPGMDGLVRSCKVGYGIPKETGDITKYVGRRWVTITRSVQRLSLLLAVEEQDKPLTVEGGNIVVKSTDESVSDAASVVERNSVETTDKDSTVPVEAMDKDSTVPVEVMEEVPAGVEDVAAAVEEEENYQDTQEEQDLGEGGR